MMGERYFYPSLTRISDLQERDFEVRPLPREQWELGDYAAARVVRDSHASRNLELDNGRIIEVMSGDRLIGALGKRAATLGGCGDWEAIGSDGRMHALTMAGLLGRATSVCTLYAEPMELEYAGHVMRNGTKVTMGDFVPEAGERALEIPVVLLVGTSMSAGKTTTGRVVVHLLKDAGLRVAGAKVTGAGRYRDVLAFADAGADHILDFVDAGLPSTVVPPQRFAEAMRHLLHRIAALDVDVLVVEAGASPLEPYNGDIAVEMLQPHVRCTVLSASDPYAVLGVRTAFGLEPDLVTGPATNTQAGIHLVSKLTGLRALNIMLPGAAAELRTVLGRTLGRDLVS